MIFLGTYKHTLDAKKRLVLPAKIVNKLPETIVVSRGFEGCLELRSMESYEKYANALNAFSQFKSDTRILERKLIGKAQDIQIDNAKRILIPEFLLEVAGISKDVILIGRNDKIEIWDEGKFNLHDMETEKN
jgi:MraZ protein